MKVFGLLGQKLSHSYSPAIHRMLGGYDYRLFEKSPEEAGEFLKNSGFSGLNVTIPYKKTAFAYCDELSEAAARLGNVNTVIRRPGGKLFGHNTDYFGFSYLLKKSGVSVSGKKIIILGSGGASSTVRAVMEDEGAGRIVVISRTGSDNYQNISRHYNADIIVNATPVGMYPNNGQAPVLLKNFTSCSGVFDLIYNPAKTALLLEAEKLGIPCSNGLTMLVAQAKESAEYFTGTKIPDTEIDRIARLLSAEMKNIILVGLPGSGKSSVGQLVAQKINRKFFDTDELICEKCGMSIPDIFSLYGEKGFRERETEILAEVCRGSSLVIATGGGAVTLSRNHPLIRQNGSVVWLKRDVKSLPTEGRPLSAGADLDEVLEKRAPLYLEISDFSVENTGTPEDAASKIVEVIYENSSY